DVDVPPKSEVLASGFVVPIVARGTTWSITCLHDFARRSGVYALHSDGEVLYVGQTTAGGNYGKFGERLRRHCHGPSAADSATHRLLASKTKPIRAYLMDLGEVDTRVVVELPKERKALILEQILIGLWQPPGNRR